MASRRVKVPVNVKDVSGRLPSGSLDELAEAWEHVLTRIGRAVNPETDEPLESAAEFAKRRNATLEKRHNRRLGKDLDACAREAATGSAKGSGRPPKGPLKGIAGELLNLFDLIETYFESDEEATLQDYV